MLRYFLPFVLAATAVAAPPSASATAKAISDRCEQAEEFAFEGQLQLLGQRGAAPARLLSLAKVKMASAPEGKCYLRIQPEGKDEYVLVSNGEKSWAWVPRLKQYTEEEGAFRTEGEAAEEGDSDNEHDLAETFVRAVMPVLSRLYGTAQSADFHGEAEVKMGGKKAKWPVLRVLSRPNPDNSQTLTQIAVSPDTMAIGRLLHSTLVGEGSAKTLVHLTVDFTSFDFGQVPPETFELTVPKNHKVVDAVPIPGQTGSLLLNQPAPDFELSTLDGQKMRLSELRGRPVVLSFWASWCGPCRRELPHLSELYRQYKDKGLVVLGVNDEGKGKARKFAEENGLPFPTLDDGGLKAMRLYKVHSIPTLFLIDANGKVVRFMRGAKELEVMRAALSAVGL